MVVVGAGADETEGLPVLAGTRLHQTGDLHLGHAGWDGLQLATSQLGGNLIEQGIDGVDADGAEHLTDVVFGMGNEWHDRP